MSMRLWTGLLVLAMVASGTTPSQAHLHTANGHRVAHDADHAGDPAQPLWHSHRVAHPNGEDAHGHEPAASWPADARDDERSEDVVSVGGTLASSLTPAQWAPPVHVALIVARSTFDIPLRAWTATVGALPPVHAPPLIAPGSPRAPPTPACLSV